MNERLSQEEIDEIVTKVCDKLEQKLYINIGYGIFGLAWKGILIGLIALAAYGVGVHFGR